MKHDILRVLELSKPELIRMLNENDGKALSALIRKRLKHLHPDNHVSQDDFIWLQELRHRLKTQDVREAMQSLDLPEDIEYDIELIFDSRGGAQSAVGFTEHYTGYFSLGEIHKHREFDEDYIDLAGNRYNFMQDSWQGPCYIKFRLEVVFDSYEQIYTVTVPVQQSNKYQIRLQNRDEVKQITVSDIRIPVAKEPPSYITSFTGVTEATRPGLTVELI